MISKERLEELIEQKATIWSDGYRNSHIKIKLTKHFVAKLGDSFDLYGYGCDYFGVPLNHLFETEEEAEWYKEFGCIVRSDRLELPNWKKLKCVIKGLRKRKLEFDCTCVYSFSIKDKVYRLYFCKSEDDYTIELILDDDVPLLNLQLTEENYIKACKVAKEKFLGEKK